MFKSPQLRNTSKIQTKDTYFLSRMVQQNKLMHLYTANLATTQNMEIKKKEQLKSKNKNFNGKNLTFFSNQTKGAPCEKAQNTEPH